MYSYQVQNLPNDIVQFDFSFLQFNANTNLVYLPTLNFNLMCNFVSSRDWNDRRRSRHRCCRRCSHHHHGPQQEARAQDAPQPLRFVAIEIEG